MDTKERACESANSRLNDLELVQRELRTRDGERDELVKNHNSQVSELKMNITSNDEELQKVKEELEKVKKKLEENKSMMKEIQNMEESILKLSGNMKSLSNKVKLLKEELKDVKEKKREMVE